MSVSIKASIQSYTMPPRRCASARKVLMGDVHEHDDVRQLAQQIEMLRQHLAVLQTTTIAIQHYNRSPNPCFFLERDVEDDLDKPLLGINQGVGGQRLKTQEKIMNLGDGSLGGRLRFQNSMGISSQ